MSWQSYDPCGSDTNRPVVCGDCGWEGREDDVLESIWEIDSLLERVSPGEILPVGTCPEIHSCSKDGDYPCRALVHYSDVDVAFRKTSVLDQIVEALE
jgi:hypothetical protein